MIGRKKLLADLSALARHAKAHRVTLCAHAKTRRVFRFANDAIHQDLVQEGVSVTVKVMRDRHAGVAATDTLRKDSLKRCLDAAAEIARLSPALRDAPSVPPRLRVSSTSDYVQATVRQTPAQTAAAIKRMMQITRGAGASLAGSVVTGDDEYALVNSAGSACYAAGTVAGAKLVTLFGKLSGYACGTARDVRKLDLDALLKRSLSQSLHRSEAVALPIGTYEVILEPDAVAELAVWLGYTAFGAKAFEERTSFLAGRMGERVMDPQITIVDDGTDPKSLRMPFDFEGVPRRRTVLVDKGKAAGVVYDTTYGKRAGQASTGHALPPESESEGPLPLHLAMAPGKSSREAMIRSCKRGLLIPRFHYVNGLLNPREALMTGLTREGVFLIEQGKISKPVRTLRFTQSILEAFSRVLGVSKERRLVAEPSQELGCALMPTVHLAAFKFTGRSDT